MVQVPDVPELTLVGLQAREETSVGATRLKEAVCKVPFKVAVMVALWLVVRVPTVAMKVAELAPADTVTDARIVSRALLSDSMTVMLEEAAWFKLTVQAVEAPEATVAGLQTKDVRLRPTTVVIVPPVAAIGSALADKVAPKAFVMPIEVAVVLGESVADTTATTPFWKVFALIPVNRQV